MGASKTLENNNFSNIYENEIAVTLATSQLLNSNGILLYFAFCFLRGIFIFPFSKNILNKPIYL